MKRNKRRMDARLKPYIWERIERLAQVYEATYTEIIEEALERGMNWLKNKIRKELDPAFDWKEQAPVQIEYTKKTEEILEEQIKTANINWLDQDS